MANAGTEKNPKSESVRSKKKKKRKRSKHGEPPVWYVRKHSRWLVLVCVSEWFDAWRITVVRLNRCTHFYCCKPLRSVVIPRSRTQSLSLLLWLRLSSVYTRIKSVTGRVIRAGAVIRPEDRGPPGRSGSVREERRSYVGRQDGPAVAGRYCARWRPLWGSGRRRNSAYGHYLSGVLLRRSFRPPMAVSYTHVYMPAFISRFRFRPDLLDVSPRKLSLDASPTNLPFLTSRVRCTRPLPGSVASGPWWLLTITVVTDE